MWILFALPALAADWTWLDAPIPAEIDAEGLAVVQTVAQDTLADAVRTWNIDGDAGVAMATGLDEPRITIAAGTTATAEVYAVALTAEGDDLTQCAITLHTSTSEGAITWSVEPTAQQYDLEFALLQALGECLGLAPGEGPAPGPREAALTEDQTAALQAIYGEATTALIEFGHALRYDFESEGDGRAGPGETVLFIVQVLNQGDPAYDVVGDLTINTSEAGLTLLEATWEAGDIPSGEQGQLFFTFRVDTCTEGANPTTTISRLTDARSETTDLTSSFFLQCAGDPVDEEGSCGCRTGTPFAAWPLLWLPLIATRRSARPRRAPRRC